MDRAVRDRSVVVRVGGELPKSFFDLVHGVVQRRRLSALFGGSLSLARLGLARGGGVQDGQQLLNAQAQVPELDVGPILHLVVGHAGHTEMGVSFAYFGRKQVKSRGVGRGGKNNNGDVPGQSRMGSRGQGDRVLVVVGCKGEYGTVWLMVVGEREKTSWPEAAVGRDRQHQQGYQQNAVAGSGYLELSGFSANQHTEKKESQLSPFSPGTTNFRFLPLILQARHILKRFPLLSPTNLHLLPRFRPLSTQPAFQRQSICSFLLPTSPPPPSRYQETFFTNQRTQRISLLVLGLKPNI